MTEVFAPDEKLPRRDMWLLPLIVLLVTMAFLGASEVTASLMFPERGRFTCGVTDPTSGGPRQKPNCIARYKNAEGPDVEYQFNECGYRSSKPCGPKPPGTLRVVLLGTSMTMGLYVPNHETFATRTEKALNQLCQRPVEVQNMGAMMVLASEPQLIQEALKLSPDVIVMAVAPFDIQEAAPAGKNGSPKARTTLARAKLAWYKFKLKIRNSRFVLAAAHFMLLDEQMLYQVFLSNGTSKDVMASPPTAAGERRYAEFATIMDRISVELRGSGVPLVVIAVPNRIAAAMVSNRSHVEGIDPDWFGRRITEIAAQHGAIPIDVTSRFADVPHAEQLYYPVDNHPTGDAHAIIAQSLVDRLTDGSIPQLASCHSPQP